MSLSQLLVIFTARIREQLSLTTHTSSSMAHASRYIYIFAFLLVLPNARAQEAVEPARPIRVMQESPWTISAMSGVTPSMRPVQAYWDQQTATYFMNLVALFEALGLPVVIEGRIVRSADNRGSYEVNFEAGTTTYSVGGMAERSEDLTVGGFLHNGEDFLLTPPNVQKVLPAGTLEFDKATLTVVLSNAVFARDTSPFRLRSVSPTHANGPLLYGRTRKFIGGTQLSYRMTRAQRLENEVNYNGFMQVRASALGGRINADGTLSRGVSGDISTGVRSLSYLLDFPNSPALSRFEIGRTRMYQWPVRQSYDGLRLSNLPLSTRNMQHEAEIKGVAEPNALVSATVGGVVVDRVQADGQGRYVLRVPAYYGTSSAEVEISPVGGGLPTIETRYLFITEDLAPPGTFYWDLQGGRDSFDQSPFGFAQARFGISKSLSVRGGFAYADTMYTGTLGITKNLWGFISTGAEISYPEFAGRWTVRLVHGHLRVHGEGEIADKPGFAFYRRRMQGQFGTSFSRLSLFLNASTLESFTGSESTSLSGSGTVRLSRRTNLLLTAGRTMTRSVFGTQLPPRLQWKSVLTQYLSAGRLRGRIGMQGDGGRYEDIDFAGLIAYASYRSITLGTRIGYDFPAETVTASFTLRMDAPWISFNGHSSLDPVNPYHLQSMYGSVELSRGIRFSRQPRTYSSAQLQAFVDLNRNGRRDANEPPVPGLELDVVKARVERAEDGSARVDFLVPSTQYQVVIDPSSIREPDLVLPTGNTFSFMSDPGETKRIDIPVYKNTIVEGTISELPLSSPTLAVVVFYQGAEEVVRAAVSQQGRFTSLLGPGTYRLEVQDLLGKEDLGAFTRTLNVQAEGRQHLLIQPN